MQHTQQAARINVTKSGNSSDNDDDDDDDDDDGDAVLYDFFITFTSCLLFL
jgi:hypothetical protein